MNKTAIASQPPTYKQVRCVIPQSQISIVHVTYHMCEQTDRTENITSPQINGMRKFNILHIVAQNWVQLLPQRWPKNWNQ